MMKRILTPLASLKFTVVLVAMAMVLVLAGTLAQVDTSILAVQKRYFHSVLCWIDFQKLWFRPGPAWYQPSETIPGGFPMLGGYGLGLLMLINLGAAAIMKFRYNLRRIGVLLVHTSIIMLLLGEGIASKLMIESRMVINQGETATYTEDTQKAELAIIDTSPADHDNVTVIAQSALARKGTIHDSKLPFDVRVDHYYPNAELFRAQGDNEAWTAKFADMSIVAEERAPNGGTSDRNDVPAADITLLDHGKEVGRHMVSLQLRAQEVRVGDKTYLLQLRFKRYYKPFSLTLVKFSQDRYTASSEVKNFSSLVRLVDPTRNEDREALIWMNHPLRYAGETFYQSGYDGDHTTILQVVENPAWWLPYLACIIGGLGMMIHFGLHLIRFVNRQAEATAKAARPIGGNYALQPRHSPVGLAIVAVATLVALVLGYGISRPWQPVAKGSFDLAPVPSDNSSPWVRGRPITWQPVAKGAFDLAAFGRIPVMYEGRVQPLDSMARNSMKALRQRETAATDKGMAPAIQWLADTLAHTDRVGSYLVFRVDNPDVLSELGLDQNRNLFKAPEILAKAKTLDEQRALASRVDSSQQTLYQKKIMELASRASLYTALADIRNLYAVPPMRAEDDWHALGEVVDFDKADLAKTAGMDPVAAQFLLILANYQQNRPAEFNRAVANYLNFVEKAAPGVTTKPAFEAFFNQFDPFMQCMALYLIVFVLICLSWMGWSRFFLRAAMGVMIAAVVVNTLGLIGRIYISGRPPVTNLASSAIFIAWGAALLGLAVELLLRNGLGAVTGAVVGFVSVLIGVVLSLDGDSMGVLRAVLATNFWLASHVVAITLGYVAMFVAGFMGIQYVVRGMATRSLDAEQADLMSRVIYGVICFAMLFSFVGTILGGIWADQSWGRFWGWDPKENGAALIVLWNAIVLHALWCRWIGQRGLALLAIFGNVVTSWSWFGTNMLSVGLHSYGFMAAAVPWMIGFVFSQLLLIGLGAMPLRYWRSFEGIMAAEKEAVSVSEGAQ